MEANWYYARDGVQYGPITEAELKDKVNQGEVKAADLIWQKGMAEWVPARSVRPIWASSGHVASLESDTPPASFADNEGLDWETFKSASLLHVRRVFTWDLQAITPTREERSRLEAAGVEDVSAQRYAVWRRSVLWFVVPPLALAAVFSVIGGLADASELASMGVLLSLLKALAVCALPVVAYLGARSYDRLQRSHRLILIGAIITFAVPILIALAPIEWWVDVRQASRQEMMLARAMIGFAFFISLMPSVLALLPGLCRACVRTKTLLPGSIAPGWALLAGAPFQLLLSLVAFILIYHVASNVLFVLGLVLLMGAPLIYLFRYSLLTRPITRPEETRELSRLVGFVVMTAWAGVAILILFMLTGRIGEGRILGFDSNAMIRPWTGQLHAWWIEYLGRSLFITVVFADLLMRMNLSIWRQEQVFYRTPAAADYDRTMASLSENVEGIALLPPADSPPPPPDAGMTPSEAMSKSV